MIKQDEITRLINHHGVETTLIICMEELAELQQAISKFMRYGDLLEIESNLIEELADVTICMAMIRQIAGINFRHVDAKIREKMKRNMGRIYID